MARYKITVLKTGQKWVANHVEEAALILEVDVDDILWSIEECGVASTDEYSVVELD